MENKSVKILVVSHKPFKLPEGKFYVPIHAGRSVALETTKDGQINNTDLDWMLKNTIGDNTGDNISDRNRFYCECSALYWAWKNYEKLGNPDYIGLMHYRRHFIFNEDYYNSKENCAFYSGLCCIGEDFIDKQYQENIGLTDENIQEVCDNYDLIVTKDARLDVAYQDSTRDLRADYDISIKGVKVKDFDLMTEIINKDYPEYAKSYNKHIHGFNKSLYQMFIMKKELFFEYCEFLFEVLFKIEKLVDFSDYTTNGKRTLGFLAEILQSIFVWRKEEENSIKIKKLYVTRIKYPYENSYLNKLLKQQTKPSKLKYIWYKYRAKIAWGKEKERLNKKKINIKLQRKTYLTLKKFLEKNNA